jgi:hypothetical protein
MDFDDFDEYMNNLPPTSAPQAHPPLSPEDEAYIGSMDEPLDTPIASTSTSPPNASTLRIIRQKRKRKIVKSDTLRRDAIGNCIKKSGKRIKRGMTRQSLERAQKAAQEEEEWHNLIKLLYGDLEC